VIDDDRSLVQSIIGLLESLGYAATGFVSAEDFLKSPDLLRSACLILDVRMPGLNGLGLQKELEARGGCEQIIFINGHGDVPTATRAMKGGAVDFLLKPFDSDELVDAVKKALLHCKEQLRKRGERRRARSLIDKLTPREFEVLRFVIMGLLNKQIASELKTAEKTIKVHRGRVMQKLGLSSVPDLVRLTQIAGISPADARYGTKGQYPA